MYKFLLIRNLLFYVLFISSCTNKASEEQQKNNQGFENQTIIVHPDTQALAKAVESLVNNLPEGTSVEGKFVRQEMTNNDCFLIIRTTHDTALKLKINSPFSQSEIEKLQKPRASISLSYIDTFNVVSKTMEKDVQFMVTKYE